MHRSYEEHCSLHLGVQVCLGAALGISKPSSLLWFKSDLFTYALGFLMLSMGLTLTFDDFRQARSAQPSCILAGPVKLCLHTATMQQYLRLRGQQGGKIRILLYFLHQRRTLARTYFCACCCTAVNTASLVGKALEANIRRRSGCCICDVFVSLNMQQRPDIQSTQQVLRARCTLPCSA